MLEKCTSNCGLKGAPSVCVCVFFFNMTPVSVHARTPSRRALASITHPIRTPHPLRSESPGDVMPARGAARDAAAAAMDGCRLRTT